MTARNARLLAIGLSLVLICSACAGAQPWAKVAIERDVPYGRAGDRPLVLDIVRPKQPAKGPLPVICFVHGSKDNIVAPSQAVLLDEALKKAGADSTLVVVEGAGHGFVGPQVTERITAFFDKHLRGRDVKVPGEAIRPKKSGKDH